MNKLRFSLVTRSNTLVYERACARARAIKTSEYERVDRVSIKFNFNPSNTYAIRIIDLHSYIIITREIKTLSDSVQNRIEFLLLSLYEMFAIKSLETLRGSEPNVLLFYRSTAS